MGRDKERKFVARLALEALLVQGCVLVAHLREPRLVEQLTAAQRLRARSPCSQRALPQRPGTAFEARYVDAVEENVATLRLVD